MIPNREAEGGIAAAEEEEVEAADEGEIRMVKKRRRRSHSTSPRFNATIVSVLDILRMSVEIRRSPGKIRSMWQKPPRQQQHRRAHQIP